MFGLFSLLQDPVNHIRGNSNGCLDTPVGTMPSSLHIFLNFSSSFLHSRFYLTFFLACFGHCTPWFHHFSWFTSTAMSLPPAPLYYPTFLKCYVLYPREKGSNFPRNVRIFLPGYTELHPQKQYPSAGCCFLLSLEEGKELPDLCRIRQGHKI